MSMDLTPFLFGEADAAWELRKRVSLWVGMHRAAGFLGGYPSRHDKDYAFWLSLFGVVAFWGGLSMLHSDSELNKLECKGRNRRSHQNHPQDVHLGK